MKFSFLRKKIYSNFYNKKIYKIKLSNIFINRCTNRNFTQQFSFFNNRLKYNSYYKIMKSVRRYIYSIILTKIEEFIDEKYMQIKKREVYLSLFPIFFFFFFKYTEVLNRVTR